MQASQLLVGRFAGRDGYGIAFPEFCASGPPIILRQNGDGTFVPEEGSTGGAGTFTARSRANRSTRTRMERANQIHAGYDDLGRRLAVRTINDNRSTLARAAPDDRRMRIAGGQDVADIVAALPFRRRRRPRAFAGDEGDGEAPARSGT